MGTSYGIISKDGLELALDEHSNIFDLSIISKFGYMEVSNLSVAEVEDIITKLTQVLMYWTDQVSLRERLIAKISEMRG